MTSPLLPLGRTIIGVFMLADRDLLLLIVAVVACLTTAATLWWSRRERPLPETILFAALTFCALTVLAFFLFKYVIGVPMARLDLIHMTADL